MTLTRRIGCRTAVHSTRQTTAVRINRAESGAGSKRRRRAGVPHRLTAAPIGVGTRLTPFGCARPAYPGRPSGRWPRRRRRSANLQTLQTWVCSQTLAKCCARARRMAPSAGSTRFAWGMDACADHNNSCDHHHRHHHHGSVAIRDDGDGGDGRRVLFTPASTEISTGDPTVTQRRVPASTPGCPAGRAVRARRRCDPGAPQRTRGTGNASAARCAGRAG